MLSLKLFSIFFAGYATIYNSESENGLWLRWTFGLMFLEPEEVDEAFFFLVSKAPVEVRPFYDYLCENYIGEGAKFPPSMWAAFDSTIQRTTNACESFHCNFNHQFASAHPNIHSFTSIIKIFQEDVTINIRSVMNTDNENTCQKYVRPNLFYKCAKRELIMKEYEDGDIDMFTYVKKMSRVFRPCKKIS